MSRVFHADDYTLGYATGPSVRSLGFTVQVVDRLISLAAGAADSHSNSRNSSGRFFRCRRQNQ